MVTDLFMPEMDGIEMIAALRRQFPGAHMIAMSGRPGVDYWQWRASLASARTCGSLSQMDELLAALKDGR